LQIRAVDFRRRVWYNVNNQITEDFLKMKRNIYVTLGAIVLIVIIAAAGLIGCGALRTPNPIDIDVFAAEAEERGFAISEDGGWTVASSEYVTVRVRQFATASEATQEFNRRNNALSNEFRSRSRSSEASGTNHSSWVFNASGIHIRLWRVYDVVVYGRGRTADRDTMSDFFGAFIIRD